MLENAQSASEAVIDNSTSVVARIVSSRGVSANLQLDIDVGVGVGDGDNVTDWCLAQFRARYPDLSVTKDDIWWYLYGVMHAPDWRERYRHDLQRNLPRVPLADDFVAFRDAGAELMGLHINYESCPEHPDVVCEVDEVADDGEHSDSDVYRLQEKLRWAKCEDEPRRNDLSKLWLNDRCCLVNIPSETHDYQVSGRSPLQWAVSSLAVKKDKESGIVDDPNGWYRWVDDPFELVRHLRRLTFLGVRSAEIIAALPPSLSDSHDVNVASEIAAV